MADLTVYRSTHPDVVAAWRKLQTDATAIGKARAAYLDELGFPGRQALVLGQMMLGVAHSIDDGPLPAGWRWDAKTRGAIVPDRRTVKGKQIDKRLAELTVPGREVVLLGGMPDTVWALEAGHTYDPGVRLLGDAVYVTWSCTSAQVMRRVRDFDSGMWQQIKLSEYYAAVEAHEAAKAANADG